MNWGINFGCCRTKGLGLVGGRGERTKTTYMMRKVGVHDDHKVSRAEVEAMNICGPGVMYSAFLEGMEEVLWLTRVLACQRVVLGRSCPRRRWLPTPSRPLVYRRGCCRQRQSPPMRAHYTLTPTSISSEKEKTKTLDVCEECERYSGAHFSANTLASSHMIMGRFLRSL